MASTTPNIGLTRPVGTEKRSRAIWNNNFTILDTKIGAVGNTSLQAQVTALNSQKLNKYRHNISGASVITTTHISNAITACANAGYHGGVAIEFYRTDQSIVTGTLYYNLTSALYGAGVLTSYYNDYMYSVFCVNGTITMKRLAEYESGTWTPKLYDLDTYLRDLSGTSGYIKLGGGLTFAYFYATDPNLSGISTMMQIRNLPMNLTIGGGIYINSLTGDEGGKRTVQSSNGRLYFRPNILSSQISNPTAPGYVSFWCFGIA